MQTSKCSVINIARALGGAVRFVFLRMIFYIVIFSGDRLVDRNFHFTSQVIKKLSRPEKIRLSSAAGSASIIRSRASVQMRVC